MGRSAGTGSPVWFRCYQARREPYGALHVDRDHTVTLTGRTRPSRPKRGSMRGSRSTGTDREYTCSCGYTGWSNHVDLEKMEAR